ncbi:hypothetical protein [Streptococcus dentiloxodontae]
MSKQVGILLGIVLFAFINVFLFDEQKGIGFSVFSTLILLTIGLLSRRTTLRVLGIISYLVNVITALFGFNYLGWLTGVQAIELIFAVWYLYPRDTFLKNDTTNRFIYRYRWVQLIQAVAITIAAYIGFNIVSHLWEGSFLEFGGNAAFIFGIQYLLFTFLSNARARENVEVQRSFEAAQFKQQQMAVMNNGQPAKNSAIPAIATNTFVKFASIWLIVMDLSILSYLIKPNDLGFGIGAFFVLLSIVLSLFIKTHENTADVFSVIYHKIRPVQPVFFIILLIAHAHKFSYGAAYALLFAVIYFIWALNKINMKTLLTVTILIYFFPVLGYISNPFRLGAANIGEAVKLIVDTGEVNYFDLSNWLSLSQDDNNANHIDPLIEAARDFGDRIELKAYGENEMSSGTQGELSFSYDFTENTVTIEDETTYDELVLEDLDSTYDKYQSLSKKDNDKRYLDYYYVGKTEGDYGTYSFYLKMDSNWLNSYKSDPSSVTYTILVVGFDRTPKEVYESTDW